MKITLEMNNEKYSFESGQDDYPANDLKEIFSRLMVQAGFPPIVIESRDGGHYVWEYKENE